MVYTVVNVCAMVKLVEQCRIICRWQLWIIIVVLFRTIKGTRAMLRAWRIMRKRRETLRLLRSFIQIDRITVASIVCCHDIWFATFYYFWTYLRWNSSRVHHWGDYRNRSFCGIDVLNHHSRYSNLFWKDIWLFYNKTGTLLLDSWGRSRLLL